ncbi:MAG: hypothetical protein KGS72_02635 [Cyanobacteria bacterium REEB67]|nr:hypothetical protein [Cyanobacteria bacterium REEB67]
MKKLLAMSLSALALANVVSAVGLLTPGATPSAMALDQADDVGVFGSVTLARLAREAAKSMKNKDYPTAVTQYRQCLSQKSDFNLFNYGLLYCALNNSDWSSASTALDGITEKDPEAKGHLNYEYGHVYSMNGRWDEAIPLLKTALTKANTDCSYLYSKVKELQTKTDEKAPELVAGTIDPSTGKLIPVYKEPEKLVIPKREIIGADKLNPDVIKGIGADYENAFRASEWIGICEYKGYEKKPGLGFYNPPTANFSRLECLKGPPLATALPVHFKFYDVAGAKPPEGWKFGDDKMPAKGSQWIIFIPNAVPVNGAFDTYKGDYGRQPATEENLGEIRRIIEAHHGQI